MLKRTIFVPALTGLYSLALTLVLWVLVVMLFDHVVRGDENLFWAGSLWLAAITSTIVVAYVRFSRGTVLGCTITFAVFSVVYLACEGPIFGDVSRGGDPRITTPVVGNLIAIPLGVFVAREIGAWLGVRRHLTLTSPTRQPRRLRCPCVSRTFCGLVSFFACLRSAKSVSEREFDVYIDLAGTSKS